MNASFKIHVYALNLTVSKLLFNYRSIDMHGLSRFIDRSLKASPHRNHPVQDHSLLTQNENCKES